MNITELRLISSRLNIKTFYITEVGFAITHDVIPHIDLGWYTGTDESVLATTIKVEPDDEYPTDWVYDETPMSKDFEKKCSETEMWNKLAHDEDIKKYADEYVKDMYSYAKDQEFNPLEYLFTGAPIMIEGSTEWFPYDKKYDHDNLRFPTIEESPLNMKLAWHPKLEEPEGINNYEYIVWYENETYPHAHPIRGNVTAIMLLKKKEEQ